MDLITETKGVNNKERLEEDRRRIANLIDAFRISQEQNPTITR